MQSLSLKTQLNVAIGAPVSPGDLLPQPWAGRSSFPGPLSREGPEAAEYAFVTPVYSLHYNLAGHCLNCRPT
jgi:hypothetical protein